MRVTFHQRRRTPAFRFIARGDEEPQPEVPVGGAPADDELSGDETSDDEFADSELDDGETSDEETDDEPEYEGDVGTPPPKDNTPPSTPVLPGTAMSSTSTVPTQTATISPTYLPPASSTLVSSQSIPAMATNTLSPSSSLPSSAIPVVSPSATSVLNLDDLTTPTATASPQTSNPPLEVPQSSNAINPPDETSSSSDSSQKAGQIAGGTIGGIAFVGLILLAIWLWRRRRNRDNRLSTMLPDDTQYMNQPPGGPEKTRSPSSIMNQLMTAAYAAEEGRDYRDSNLAFDNYANEKQGFTAHENESMERLTSPPAAQLRHQSIAARTESTEKTESTWKTWGVLAGSSRVPQPRNWWVDRYFRT